ncbi:MAG: V-type ATP synthase subunit F [Candidatus Nitrosocaldaceae archaeon]
MRIVVVGSRVFVTSFQLAGMQGVIVESPMDAITHIKRLVNDKDNGLILISDDISKSMRKELAELRTKKPVPLIFELPSPGSKKESVDYRALLKQILGV